MRRTKKHIDWPANLWYDFSNPSLQCFLEVVAIVPIHDFIRNSAIPKNSFKSVLSVHPAEWGILIDLLSMLKRKLNYQRIGALLFLSSVFILALYKVENEDAWLHLVMGRLIWDTGGLPAKEPFLYTIAGEPFSYSSWLFGLTYYLAYRIFDIPGVILLKALIVTATFYILLMDSLRPYKNHVVAMIILGVVVIICRPRFVERPDTFMMLFLAFSIFSLNAFVYDGKKYIYALPFVHMLWANSHSSINLMFVPFLSFIAGGILSQFMCKNRIGLLDAHSSSQLMLIVLVFILSFAASLLSPYFISQYTLGAQILTSEWLKKELTELRPPAWQTDKAPYLISIALVVSFLLNWLAIYNSKFAGVNKKYPTVIYTLLVIPFIILSFTSWRFIFPLAIVSGPVLVRNISLLFDGIKETFYTRYAAALAAAWILFYTVLSIPAFGPFGDQRKEIGFGVKYDLVPEKALKYMDKRDITGRVFNTFQWGQYILWRDFPKRSVSIDGRGHNISDDLLIKMDVALHKAHPLDELYKTYGFESILIQYPQPEAETTEPGTDLALSSPGWALVYWDDLSLLYLKRGGKYEKVIEEDEYKFIKPANGVYKSILGDVNYRSNLIKELKRNIEETDSSTAYIYLGFILNEMGLYKDAIECYSKVRNIPKQSHIADAYNGMAYAYDKIGNLDESVNYYKRSLAVIEDANILYDLGVTYLKKGDKRSALEYFNKAIKLNSGLASLYPLPIGVYRELGDEANVRKLSRMYEDAKRNSKRGESRHSPLL